MYIVPIHYKTADIRENTVIANLIRQVSTEIEILARTVVNAENYSLKAFGLDCSFYQTWPLNVITCVNALRNSLKYVSTIRHARQRGTKKYLYCFYSFSIHTAFLLLFRSDTSNL